MLIDFVQIQKQKFEDLAQNIVDRPEKYLDFDSVSDFYKAQWLNDFPQGTTWTAIKPKVLDKFLVASTTVLLIRA
jgi:hypothetical protein